MTELNTFVEVWNEIDPTLNVRIDRETGIPSATNGDVLNRVSPLGRTAMSVAANVPNARITAFATGTGHRESLQHALAAGATRAVELTTDAGASDQVSIASLATWLRDENPDLVIAGRRAGPIAGHLGWSHLAGLERVKIESNRLRTIRNVGRGDREIVTARLPAIVRLHGELLRPPYISRARIQAVSANKIHQKVLPEDVTSSSIDAGRLQPARTRTRLGEKSQVRSERGMDRLGALMTASGGNSAESKLLEPLDSSPEQMAEEFVRYLVHHQLLASSDTTKYGQT